ncbi:MAG: division/cell wall cluster transcriptional repressor MraZ [Lachnospiraceae bacterium]|nr:division/cell wall cluster transcriptional repressor MraZ [Lachnospiraceae bacterium]
MLTGEYNHTMDAKGRVTIPARFREELGASFTVTRGFEGCLTAYPAERWARIRKNLESLSLTNTAGRKLSRLFLGNAIECEVDQMGRILIPNPLRNAADLKKDIVFTGLGDRVEIWDKEAWDAVNGKDALENMTPEELSKLEELEL